MKSRKRWRVPWDQSTERTRSSAKNARRSVAATQDEGTQDTRVRVCHYLFFPSLLLSPPSSPSCLKEIRETKVVTKDKNCSSLSLPILPSPYIPSSPLCAFHLLSLPFFPPFHFLLFLSHLVSYFFAVTQNLTKNAE